MNGLSGIPLFVPYSCQNATSATGVLSSYLESSNQPTRTLASFTFFAELLASFILSCAFILMPQYALSAAPKV
jgi:hypothetical protein